MVAEPLPDGVGSAGSLPASVRRLHPAGCPTSELVDGLGPVGDEPRLVGVDHRLHAVPDAEFTEITALARSIPAVFNHPATPPTGSTTVMLSRWTIAA